MFSIYLTLLRICYTNFCDFYLFSILVFSFHKKPVILSNFKRLLFIKQLYALIYFYKTRSSGDKSDFHLPMPYTRLILIKGDWLKLKKSNENFCIKYLFLRYPTIQILIMLS